MVGPLRRMLRIFACLKAVVASPVVTSANKERATARAWGDAGDAEGFSPKTMAFSIARIKPSCSFKWFGQSGQSGCGRPATPARTCLIGKNRVRLPFPWVRIQIFSLLLVDIGHSAT